MRIYTRSGDKGTTALIGGTRVPKHHIRIETYGTVDELNTHLGMLRSMQVSQEDNAQLVEIQTNLFTMGSELATDPEKAIMRNGKKRLNISKISTVHVEQLEEWIDRINENLPPLKNFLLPGGNRTVAQSHICRTVCRRTERLATALDETEGIDENLLKYLNRLSDYLFVLSRKLSKDLKVEETPWTPKRDNQ